MIELDPEVFREAAARILTTKNAFACFAIGGAARTVLGQDVCTDAIFPYINFFQKLYEKDSDVGGGTFWWRGDWKECTPLGIEARAFALLLAADILEGGGLRTQISSYGSGRC